jgi:D-mannonate dehydratase
MKMTFRWYGKNDKISLSHIAQIPNINGVVTSLIDIPVGEVWPMEEIKELKTHVTSYNLNLDVIESVNVHEEIKFGSQNRIHFAHIRNIKRVTEKSFHETSHFSNDGSLDLYEIVKAYADINFQGHARPDHGRMIWHEKGMPGYGLFDRALGITYLNGLYEAIIKGIR